MDIRVIDPLLSSVSFKIAWGLQNHRWVDYWNGNETKLIRWDLIKLEISRKTRLSFVLSVEKMNVTAREILNDTRENATHEFMQMELFASRPETHAIIVIISIIFLVGIFGNIALLSYVLCRNRMTSPHNIYSVNLAVGDLLTLLIAMPFLSSIYVLNSWPFGEILCKLSEFVNTLSVSVTVFMITALSVERYRLLTLHPPSLNLTSASVISFILWLSAAMLAIPDLVSAEEVSYERVHFCIPYRQDWGETFAKTMVVIKFTCNFAVPLLIVTVCYFLIGYNLMSHRAQFHSCLHDDDQGTSEEEIRRNSKRKRMAALVLGLVMIFLFTWLPRHVYLMWFYFDPSPYDVTWHVIKIAGICLMFCNAALNPLVFFCFDSRFRDFLCCCRRSIWDVEEYTEIPHHSVVLTELNQWQDGTKV